MVYKGAQAPCFFDKPKYQSQERLSSLSLGHFPQDRAERKLKGEQQWTHFYFSVFLPVEEGDDSNITG